MIRKNVIAENLTVLERKYKTTKMVNLFVDIIYQRLCEVYMKKKILCAIVLIPLICYIALYFTPLNRTINSSSKFFDQVETVWESDSPKIRITVNGPETDNHYVTGTIEINGQVINTTWSGGQGIVVVDDTDKMVGEYFSSDVRVFTGDCKFSKKKLKIKVTSSNIDGIEVGDKIVVYRKD